MDKSHLINAATNFAIQTSRNCGKAEDSWEVARLAAEYIYKRLTNDATPVFDKPCVEAHAEIEKIMSRRDGDTYDPVAVLTVLQGLFDRGKAWERRMATVAGKAHGYGSGEDPSAKMTAAIHDLQARRNDYDTPPYFDRG